jgi:hypothetical protein
MSARYAVRTKVPVEQTRTEIERLLRKYGADRFAYFGEPARAIIVFEANDRRIKFTLPLPIDGPRAGQDMRSRWRALLLCIQAKLESVQCEIETFDDAFMAHIVMPDGSTVGEYAAPRLPSLSSPKNLQPLLPSPKG